MLKTVVHGEEIKPIMKRHMRRMQLYTVFLATVAIMMGVILVQYPEQAFAASLKGLKIWWDVVFPALFPFFVVAEMMMGFGVVHFVGILLEPLMRPIFRVPGTGAFVMAVGFISGNPMGAKLTAKLRKQNLLTQIEGERLLTFTSTASPLFLFGAVAVGFFENAQVGLLLALAHYGSALLVGFCMRFYHADAASSPTYQKQQDFILIRALRAMHRARLKEERSFGQLLGESVHSSIQTLLMIGGFIMIFSVIINLIQYLGILQLFAQWIAQFFAWFSLPPDLSAPFFAGLVEMTIGSQMTSEMSVQIPLVYKLTIVSMIIGWSGLSIHAQILSMISRTSLRYLPYLCGKTLHAILAGLLTWVIWVVLHPYLYPINETVATWAPLSSDSSFWWHGWKELCMFIGVGWLAWLLMKQKKPSY